MSNILDDISKPTTPPSPEEAFAKPVYPQSPAEPPAPGEFYSPGVALGQTFVSQRETVSDVLGLTMEQQHQRERDFTKLVRETGLNPYDTGKRLYELMTQADVAAMRGEGPDDAQIQTWNEETRSALRETYGAQDGEQMLARLRKFVHGHPALERLLGRHGLGSRKEIVLGLASKIHSDGYF